VIRTGKRIDLLCPEILKLSIDANIVMDLLLNLEPMTLGVLQVGSVFKTPTISTTGLATSALASSLWVRPICRIALPALPVKTAAISIKASERLIPAKNMTTKITQ
jgi:hypothetical protein